MWLSKAITFIYQKVFNMFQKTILTLNYFTKPMNRIIIIKYISPIIIAAGLTFTVVGGSYLYNKYSLDRYYKNLQGHIRTIEAVDSVYLNDDIKIITDTDNGSLGNCTLFHGNKRLSGTNLLKYIETVDTNLNIKLCTYLQAIQNLHYTGSIQYIYIGFNEKDKNTPSKNYFLSSNSAINYRDPEKYSAFNLNITELSLTNNFSEVQRLVYIDNSTLPHLSFINSILNPFKINIQPDDFMDLKDYTEKVKNTNLKINLYFVLLLYIFFTIIATLLYKFKIIDLYKIRAELEFRNSLKYKSFIIIDAKRRNTILTYCSEKENIENAEVTYYNQLGLELDQYDESARFVKVNVEDFSECYRLIETEKNINLAHSRVAVKDNKLFDSIGYYKDNHTKDSLTGLYNRTELRTFINEHQNTNKLFLIALIDLDKFKDFNDTYGHDFGDTVLVHTANFLKKNFKQEHDMILRIGGEEFLIILEVTTDINTLVTSIEKRLLSFNQQALSMSGGITVWETNVETFDNAHKRVDELLYQSKHNGRAQVTIDPNLSINSAQQNNIL